MPGGATVTITGAGAAAAAGNVAQVLSLVVDQLHRLRRQLEGIWATIIDNTGGLERKVSRIQESFVSIGQEVGTSLKPAFEAAARAAETMEQIFKRLPQPVKDYLAALFALLSLITLLTTALMSLVIFLAPLASAFGPLIVAAAALYSAWKNNLFGIRRIATLVFGGLEALVKGVAAAIKLVWKAALRVLGAHFKIAFALIKTVVQNGLDLVLSLFQAALAVLALDFQRAAQIMVGWLDRAIGRWLEFGKQVTSIVNGLVSDAIEWGKSMLKKIIQGFNEKKQALASKVDQIRSSIKDPIMSLVNSAKDWATDLIDEFISGILEGEPRLKNAADIAADAVKNFLEFDIPANDRMARRWGSDLVSEFATGMQRNLRTLRRAVPSGDPAAFGLAPPGGAGGPGTSVDVTVEAGAVQLSGGSTARVNADRTADGIAREFADRFGRRS